MTLAVATSEIYCDPNCGKGCTKEEHDRIVEIANGLADQCGEGWTTRIWDNLGWHYEVVSPCGRLRIQDVSRYPYGDFTKGFTCYISPPGEVYIDWKGEGKTPRAASQDALSNMMEAIGYLFHGARIGEELLPEKRGRKLSA